MWIYDNKLIPSYLIDLPNLYRTKGYSIENELFSEGEGFLIDLLDSEEKNTFYKLFDSVSMWFSYQAHLYITGGTCSFADKNVCSTNFIDANFKIIDSEYYAFNHSTSLTINMMNSDRNNFLRGKFIFCKSSAKSGHLRPKI